MGLTRANAYFASRLNSETWDSATDANKVKALNTAELQMDFYKTRIDSTSFCYAVYEQAIWLLAGDSRAELQQAGVQSMSLGSLSETYRETNRDLSIAPKAWMFLRGPFVKTGGLR